MYQKIFIIFILIFSIQSCSKNEPGYEPKSKIDAYKTYQEGLAAFEKRDYFYAEKKFSEAELNFELVEFAAKSAIMASYSLYGINFYDRLKYPDTDYAIDLRYKKDLIQNQLAAKELYVAKYYIATQKWVPAINRLKIIVKEFQQTVFIEEALHRLVEIHYYLGLDDEAKIYAKILGYNYNSSEWFEQSYKVLNKDYEKIKKAEPIKEENFIKKILDKIK